MIIKPLFLLTIFIITPSLAIDITCIFSDVSSDLLANAYSCDVKTFLGIRSASTTIDSIRGSHTRGRNNDNVLRFSADDSSLVIHYIPMNLATHFKNIEAIRIRNGRVKEIHQSDFKNWPKLKTVNMDYNDVEVLEDDLFKFNTKLERIWMEGNKIKAIGVTALGYLVNLKDLDLTSSPCGGSRVENDKVAKFVWEIVGRCAIGGDWRENLRRIDVKNKIEELKMKVEGNKMKNEIESVKVEAESEKKILENEIQNLTVKIQTQSDEIEKLRSESLNFNATTETLELNVQNLQSEIDEKKEKISKLSTQILVLNSQIKNVTGQLSLTSSKLLHTETKLSNKIQSLQDENEELKVELSEKSLEIQKFIESSGNYSEIIQQLESEVKSKEKKILEAEKNFTNFRENFELKFDDLMLKFNESKANFTQLSNENEKLKEELSTAENLKQNLQTLNETFIIERRNFTQIASDLQLSNEILEISLNTLQTNFSLISSEKSQIEQKLNETEQTLKILTDENSNLLQQLENFKFSTENLATIEAQKLELLSKNDELQSLNDKILFIVLPFVAFLSIGNVILIVACLKKKEEGSPMQVHLSELKKHLRERSGTMSSDDES